LPAIPISGFFLGALLQFVIVFFTAGEVLHLDETRGGLLKQAGHWLIGIRRWKLERPRGYFRLEKIEYGLDRPARGHIGMSAFGLRHLDSRIEFSFKFFSSWEPSVLQAVFSLSGQRTNPTSPGGEPQRQRHRVAKHFLSFVGVITTASAIYSGATHYLHTGGWASFFIWDSSDVAGSHDLHCVAAAGLFAAGLMLWIGQRTRWYRLDVEGREECTRAWWGVAARPITSPWPTPYCSSRPSDRPIRFNHVQGLLRAGGRRSP